MFRPIYFVFAVIAVAAAQRSFINKCSLSAPDLEECFVKNGNLAIEELHYGVEDLDLPSLEGYDAGDIFLNLENDLSFLIEDAKTYPKGIRLENAHLKFGSEKQLRGLELFFSLQDVTWQVKYHAIGILNGHKVNEKGSAEIKFGQFSGKYTTEFRRREIDGVGYLKAENHSGVVAYEKFEFIPSNVKAQGKPLLPEDFNQVEKLLVDQALEISLNIVTFTFDQIFQEIPENEIFLP